MECTGCKDTACRAECSYMIVVPVGVYVLVPVSIENVQRA